MRDLPDWQYGFALIPRTALRPSQQPYWAVAGFELDPYSYTTFMIEKGFDYYNEWIPTGKRFSIWWLKFSTDQNSLIETRVYVESSNNPGSLTVLAGQWGYGQTEYLSGIFFDFESGTRPIYYIANYSDSKITVDFVVFGVTEVII